VHALESLFGTKLIAWYMVCLSVLQYWQKGNCKFKNLRWYKVVLYWYKF